MDKSLYFQVFRRFGTDPSNVLQGRFAGENDGVRPHVIEHVCRGAVDNAQLGADVTPKTRRVTPGQAHNAQIRDDQRIDADLLQERKIVRETLELLFMRKGIAGHIDLCALRVSRLHSRFHRLVVKAYRRGTQPEFPSREIDRIGAVMQRHPQPFKIARRRKKLKFLSHWHAPRYRR